MNHSDQVKKIEFLDSFSDEEWLLNGHQKTDLIGISNIYDSFIPFIKEGNYLECGCGTGILARYLYLFSGENIIPYGIDINRRSIIIAKSNNPDFRANFITGDYLTTKSFKDLDFSTIFFFVPSNLSFESAISVVSSMTSSINPSILIIFYDFSLLALKSRLLNYFLTDKNSEFLVADSDEYFIHLFRRF